MADWNVRVAATTNESPTAEHVDTMLETLAGYSPTASASGDPPSIEATVVVQAVNLRAALTTGMKVVGAALRTTGLHGAIDLVEAKSNERVDRERAHPPVPELVGAAEIAGMIKHRDGKPVTRSYVNLLAKRDDFPSPVAELAAGNVYLRQQVEAFLRHWPRKRTGRPKKTPPLMSVV